MTPEGEIRRVLALYCHYIDQRNKEGYVSLFSKDTRLHTPRAIREGHPGIWDHIEDVYSRWQEGLLTKHLMGCSDIEVNGQSATAVSDVVVFQCMPESSWSIRQTARYVDDFVIEDGVWRIKERRIESDTYVLQDSGAQS